MTTQINNTPQGYKDTPLGMIPKEWEVKKLGDLGKIISGMTPLRSNLEYHSGNIHWVKTTDLNNGIILDTEEKVTENALEKTSLKILPLGTVLVAMYGGFNQIGRTGLLGINATINQALSAILPNNEIFDNFFLQAWLNAKVKLWKNYAGSSRKDPNITSKDVADFPIPLPPLPEQQKIAEILSVWDRAIDVETRLIVSLQTRKRALMQQLLTGKKRLKEFSREWIDVEFDDIYFVCNAKKFQINKSDYKTDGLYPIIDQGQSKIAGYTDEKYPYKELPVIIFGDHTRIVKWINFPFYPGADGTQLIKTKSLCDMHFGFYLLWNADIPNLGYSRHMKELKNKIFSIPADKNEQTAIAEILSAADKEINIAQKKLAKMKSPKKGLMQVLLTGKKRVKI
jgi:type I restriction enzyme S subunit